jgi:hypothetical protein
MVRRVQQRISDVVTCRLHHGLKQGKASAFQAISQRILEGSRQNVFQGLHQPMTGRGPIVLDEFGYHVLKHFDIDKTCQIVRPELRQFVHEPRWVGAASSQRQLAEGIKYPNGRPIKTRDPSLQTLSTSKESKPLLSDVYPIPSNNTSVL